MRVDLDAHLTSWISLLAAALERMKSNGTLAEDADPQTLATGIMAALQGYVLAQVARDPEPMRIALDLAMNSVRAHAKSPNDNENSLTSPRHLMAVRRATDQVIHRSGGSWRCRCAGCVQRRQ